MRRAAAGAGLCIALALACARPATEQVHAELSPRPQPSAAPARSAATALVGAPGAPQAPSAPAAPEPVPAAATSAAGPLRAFFDALRQLESGARTQHVRVLWLGDSHTAADFLTGSVRAALQARFGDGGPGFVRIGTRHYRHSAVKVKRDGKWNVDPDPPARRSRQDDGIFGWAGTRAVPGARASFSVELSPRPSGDETGSFELSYSLPPGSSFDLELGGKRTRVGAQSASASAAGVSYLTLAAPLRSQLVVTPGAGAPRLLGVVIERSAQSGVVLDTAGIDGARIETPLSWDEAAFVAGVARRSPELFVVAYGTNEAFDALAVERYDEQLRRLIGRLRSGAPHASCLVLGPTDAARGDGSVPRILEITRVLRRAAAALGCSFVSLQELMGGEGSFLRGMQAKERLAQLDRLHLTPKGYTELGQALAQQLLDAYSSGWGDLP